MKRLWALCLVVASSALGEPAKAKVTVTTVPQGALVSFDLDEPVPGPRSVNDIAPGDHRVEAFGKIGGTATVGGIWYVGAKNFALTEGQELSLELQMKVDGQFNRRLEAQVVIDACSAVTAGLLRTLPLVHARATKALPRTNLGLGVATSGPQGQLAMLAPLSFSAEGVKVTASTNAPCTETGALVAATQLAASAGFQLPLGLHRRAMYVVTASAPKKRDLEALQKWSATQAEVLIVVVPTAALASAWAVPLKKLPRAVAVAAAMSALPQDATDARVETAAAWIEPVVAAHQRFLATLPEAK
jgi:hypothetical protein